MLFPTEIKNLIIAAIRRLNYQTTRWQLAREALVLNDPF
jgi:hypothetical protein